MFWSLYDRDLANLESVDRWAGRIKKQLLAAAPALSEKFRHALVEVSRSIQLLRPKEAEMVNADTAATLELLNLQLGDIISVIIGSSVKPKVFQLEKAAGALRENYISKRERTGNPHLSLGGRYANKALVPMVAWVDASFFKDDRAKTDIRVLKRCSGYVAPVQTDPTWIELLSEVELNEWLSPAIRATASHREAAYRAFCEGVDRVNRFGPGMTPYCLESGPVPKVLRPLKAIYAEGVRLYNRKLQAYTTGSESSHKISRSHAYKFKRSGETCYMQVTSVKTRLHGRLLVQGQLYDGQKNLVGTEEIVLDSTSYHQFLGRETSEMSFS